MYDGKHVVPLLLSIPLDSDHSLMTTIAQVVETSVATEDAHPFEDQMQPPGSNHVLFRFPVYLRVLY